MSRFRSMINLVLRSLAITALIYAFMLATGIGMGSFYYIHKWWDGVPVFRIVGLVIIALTLFMITEGVEDSGS